MNFNRHSELEGQHAFLSASKYHWVNYDEDKLAETYRKYLATQRGTTLHDLACRLITENIVLPRTKKTFNMYVNDAIGYKMQPEQPLCYSENCFGTADAISFKKNILRIHDLKTGETPASVRQLEIYAALFCLEYDINPTNIQIELRLYQSDEVVIHQPAAEDILYIMDKIIKFDKEIDKIKMSE
jgi:hypothetical protein